MLQAGQELLIPPSLHGNCLVLPLFSLVIERLPVTVLTGTAVKRFEANRVIIERAGNEAELPGFASVVLAVGTRSVNALSAELRERGFSVYTVGDARSPRRAISMPMSTSMA